MEGLQEFVSLVDGIITGAMLLPVVVSVALGAICAIWNVFN